ncbi:MAG: IS30 family transposase [Hornefia sp.]|nr:IS30 family transposase [Hornefia sp.]
MKHLTLNDRFELKRLLNEGYKKKEIAVILGCHPNTITNELKRLCDNTRDYKNYNPGKAHKLYRKNLLVKGVKPKLLIDKKLYDYIRIKLVDEKFSPYACIMQMIKENKQFAVMITSANTIYKAITKGLFPGVVLENIYRRKRIRKKKKLVRTQNRAVAGKSIERRSEAIDTREEFGHWEMDCVIGKQTNNRTMLVLTERKTRFEIIELLKYKTSKEVVRALNRIEKKMGKHFYKIFKTITVDNGSEFSDCEGMEKALYRVGKRHECFYCHPYSSHERGSNENNNILIRYWLPKGSDFDNAKIFNRNVIKKIQHWINNYPRAMFNSDSSLERYSKELERLNIPLSFC